MGCGTSKKVQPLPPPPDPSAAPDFATTLPPGVDETLAPFGTDSGRRAWSVVVVHMIEAKNLPDSDWLSSPDAYVRCKLIPKNNPAPSAEELKPLTAGMADVNACFFSAKENTKNPKWDAKRSCAFRREGSPDAELHIQLLEKDSKTALTKEWPLPWKTADEQADKLGEASFPIPDDSAKWVDHTFDINGGGTLHFRVRAYSAATPFTSAEDLAGLTCEEHIVDGDTPNERVSVLYKRQEPSQSRGIFWLPGRNDTFMHPHVAKEFLSRGFDFYTLDCRRLGRSKRFMDVGQYFSSHPSNGPTFEYSTQDIERTLSWMGWLDDSDSRPMKRVVYVHSTGGAMLCHYLMNSPTAKSKPFTHIVMNSPLLGFEFCNREMDSTLEDALACAFHSKIVSRKAKPDTVVAQGSHSVYAFVFKVWLQYHVDLSLRPILFRTHATLGFLKATAAVGDQLEKQKGTLTDAPILCLTSKNDPVLDWQAISERAKWLGPNAEVELLDRNSHDVLLSADYEDTQYALKRITTWIDGTVLSNVEESSA